MGQYHHPVWWNYDELMQLPSNCLRSWVQGANDKGKLSRDSTEAYCMCFDKATRRLDWIVNEDGSNGVEGHRQFLPDGSIVSTTEKQMSPVLSSVSITRNERSAEGLVVRIVHLTVPNLQWNFPADSSGIRRDILWDIDSLFYVDLRSSKTIHTSWVAAPLEITLFEYVDGRKVQTTYNTGARTKSTTWVPAIDPVIVVDSIFFIDSLGTEIRRRIQEERLSYKDGKCVDYERTEWAYSWSIKGWDRDGIYKANAILTRPPERTKRTYAYDGGQLKTETHFEEGERSMDTIVFHYQNGLLTHSSEATPKAIRDPNSVLLEFWPNKKVYGTIRRYRFQYVNERPNNLTDGGAFDWLKTYEPK